jgi:hypothetical protein
VDGGVISEITTMVIHVERIGLLSVLPKRFSVPWFRLFRISFLRLPQARAEIFVLEDMTRIGNAVM